MLWLAARWARSKSNEIEIDPFSEHYCAEHTGGYHGKDSTNMSNDKINTRGFLWRFYICVFI